MTNAAFIFKENCDSAMGAILRRSEPGTLMPFYLYLQVVSSFVAGNHDTALADPTIITDNLTQGTYMCPTPRCTSSRSRVSLDTAMSRVASKVHFVRGSSYNLQICGRMLISSSLVYMMYSMYSSKEHNYKDTAINRYNIALGHMTNSCILRQINTR